MKEWEEIRKLAHINREEYEYEYTMRKTYDKMLPMVDNIYVSFVMFAWSKGYNDIAKWGANECWKKFCAEVIATPIAEWIKNMEQSVCGLELKKYFNNKIKNTSKFIGRNDK